MIVADLRQGGVYWTETDSVIEVIELRDCVIQRDRGRGPLAGVSVFLRVLDSPEPAVRGAELELHYEPGEVLPWDEDLDEVPI